VAGAREAGIATPAGAAVIASSYPTAPLDRLDGAGKRALARAYWEAGRANEKDVAPHHLLLALIANDEVWVHRFVTDLGVQPVAIVSCIETAWPARQAPRPGSVSEAATLAEVFALASSLAAERNSALIRSEHLLLAIASTQGIAATALDSVGATPKRIREILDRMNG